MAAAATNAPHARKTTIFKRVFSGGKGKARRRSRRAAAATAAMGNCPRMSTSAYARMDSADEDELGDLDMATFEHASEGPIYEAAYTLNPDWFPEQQLAGENPYLLPTADEQSHLYTEMTSDCASTLVHDYAEIHDYTELF